MRSFKTFFCVTTCALMAIGLLGCASVKEKEEEQAKPEIGVSSEQCFRWAAAGDVEDLKENWNTCKGANNIHSGNLMMLAASKEQIAVLDFLIEHDVNVNETDLTGDTALHYAVAGNRLDSVKWLVSHKALNKSFRKDGITPLMLALNQGSKEIAWVLLEQAYEIDAPMEDGWTALFYSIHLKDKKLLLKLLALGANPSSVAGEKETPLVLAKEQGWGEGVAILRDTMKKNAKKFLKK